MPLTADELAFFTLLGSSASREQRRAACNVSIFRVLEALRLAENMEDTPILTARGFVLLRAMRDLPLPVREAAPWKMPS
jgi:hypothetical protein